jgi:lipid II:glycine glycyltransferase (peptidoglycan interpeptide bridge formation enzyme)
MDYKVVRVLYSSIPYGTIIGNYNALPEFLSCFHDFLSSQKIGVLRLGGAYPISNPFRIEQYPLEEKQIHLLDIAGISEESLWKNYKKYLRRDIRKSENMGVKIEEIRDRSEIEDFYYLYLCSMKRNKSLAKYPKTFLYSIYDMIIAAGQGNIFFAKLEEEKIAGIMILYSQDIAHYYFGGSREEYHRYQPNEALLHKAVCKSIKLKKSIFDFMGSDPQDINLIHFKEKWGAVPRPITHYTIVKNRFCSAVWQAGLYMLAMPSVAALTRCIQSLRLAEGKSGK